MELFYLFELAWNVLLRNKLFELYAQEEEKLKIQINFHDDQHYQNHNQV